MYRFLIRKHNCNCSHTNTDATLTGAINWRNITIIKNSSRAKDEICKKSKSPVFIHYEIWIIKDSSRAKDENSFHQDRGSPQVFITRWTFVHFFPYFQESSKKEQWLVTIRLCRVGGNCKCVKTNYFQDWKLPSLPSKTQEKYDIVIFPFNRAPLKQSCLNVLIRLIKTFAQLYFYIFKFHQLNSLLWSLLYIKL